MEKRYQVFISSTYEDLQDERKEVIQALLELDCIPAGMELFPASNEDQWSLIKRVIDDCDYYILIIGGRYGSINDNGKSYTQMEYEYALDTGKPIISFIRRKPETILIEKCEKTEEGKKKLEEFKETVKKKIIRTWETPIELGSVVSRSMIKMIKDFPTEGWVKAGSVDDPESAKELIRLQKENHKLYEVVHDYEYRTSERIKELAQGEDIYEVEFVCEVRTPKCTIIETKYVRYSLTWNYLFQKVGTILLYHSLENEVYSKFLALMEPQIVSILHKQGIMKEWIETIKLGPDVLQTILIQFAALGLIQKCGKVARWEFTDYGRNEGISLMAIRRPSEKTDHLD